MAFEAFSVAMCVYGKDDPSFFDRSLQSISFEQTLKPNEIVVIVDGPINEFLENVIKKYDSLLKNTGISFKVFRFKTNQGHGKARRSSVDNSSNDIIALMDADDVSLPNRFEEQMKLMIDGIDVVGGDISEFIGEESNIVSYRRVPRCDKDIKAFAQTRCPMNQVTVMFKKESYEKAGGYLEWYQDEDYYLWVRMIEKKCVFVNTGNLLVNVRVGDDMFKRRGGINYYKSEKKLQKYMLQKHLISFPRYLVNCFKRFVVQVLLPNRIRAWAYKRFARQKVS